MTISRDPELKEDLDEVAEEIPDIELPDFDESDFTLPEDYEDGDDD